MFVNELHSMTVRKVPYAQGRGRPDKQAKPVRRRLIVDRAAFSRPALAVCLRRRQTLSVVLRHALPMRQRQAQCAVSAPSLILRKFE
jgi:hypothetical protein